MAVVYEKKSQMNFLSDVCCSCRFCHVTAFLLEYGTSKQYAPLSKQGIF